MSNRLEILKNSLAKKETSFDQKLDAHFDTVKQANGQPLNDKRNGAATLKKWERQNDSLRNLNQGIEKTKEAIEKETCKIGYVEQITAQLPHAVIDKIKDGTINQWRKFPNTFFVPGVEKGRIIWDLKGKFLTYKYLNEITDKDQYRLFAKTFNEMKSLLKA